MDKSSSNKNAQNFIDILLLRLCFGNVSLLMIFIICFVLSSLQAQLTYQGTVGDYPVVLTIEEPFIFDRDSLELAKAPKIKASYFYTKYKTLIPLTGKWNMEGDLVLYEDYPEGKTYYI